jgi:hypothetical protein
MNDDENPKGDAADRCRVYRRQIDDLLAAVRTAAAKIDNPADLWEIRRGLREIHGLDAAPEGAPS